MSRIIFIQDKDISSIQCSKEDKMGAICREYAKMLSKDLNSLSFLYEGNRINFELIFENYANGKNEITILVDKKDKEKTNNNPNKIDSYNKYNINTMKLDSNKKYFEKIKSKYIIKIIFSFMFEKIKLKTIKCNKSL